MNRILIAAIVIVIAACVGFYFWAESEKARFDASLPELSAVEEQQVIDNTVEDDTAGDTVDDTAGGHWHGDEWHAEPHRDALPDKGMHFADQQDLTGAPVTETEPITFDEIHISSEMAEILSIAEIHNPEWAEWQKEYLVYRAEEKRLQEEWDALIPPGLDTVEKAEAFLKTIDSLSNEEKRAFVQKLEALARKSEAVYGEGRALLAEEPDREHHE